MTLLAWIFGAVAYLQIGYAIGAYAWHLARENRYDWDTISFPVGFPLLFPITAFLGFPGRNLEPNRPDFFPTKSSYLFFHSTLWPLRIAWSVYGLTASLVYGLWWLFRWPSRKWR